MQLGFYFSQVKTLVTISRRRATLWKNCYQSHYFYFLESHLPPRIHLTVVMPSNPVIGSRNFNLLKNFARDLVQEFSVSSSGTRVAIVAHSSAPRLAFSWYKFMNMECTLKGILSLR